MRQHCRRMEPEGPQKFRWIEAWFFGNASIRRGSRMDKAWRSYFLGPRRAIEHIISERERLGRDLTDDECVAALVDLGEPVIPQKSSEKAVESGNSDVDPGGSGDGAVPDGRNGALAGGEDGSGYVEPSTAVDFVGWLPDAEDEMEGW